MKAHVGKLAVAALALAMIFGLMSQPAWAATSITDLTVNVTSGPAANCVSPTNLATFTYTVTGVPGGTGSYSRVLTLIGMNNVLSFYQSHLDSAFGNAFPVAIANGTGWTGPGDTPQIKVEIFVGSTSYGGAVINVDCATNTYSLSYFGFGGSGEVDGGCGANDGRINGESCAGPVALFCQGKLLDVYGVDAEGNGFFAFRAATNVEIPDETTLVKSFGDIELYHLSTGEWQVNAGPDGEGKVYVFIFGGCPYDGDGYNANLDPNE